MKIYLQTSWSLAQEARCAFQTQRDTWPKEVKDPERCSKNLFQACPNVSVLQNLINPSYFPLPIIDFHAKIIKRKYFSSAPWKQPCHWLETVSRMLRIQQGTGFSSLLGLIWFPLLLFYWRITLMFSFSFFWPKYAPAVSAAYITRDLYYEPFSASKTLLSPIISHLVKQLPP